MVTVDGLDLFRKWHIIDQAKPTSQSILEMIKSKQGDSIASNISKRHVDVGKGTARRPCVFLPTELTENLRK